MATLTEEQVVDLLKGVAHLCPQLDLPADKTQWDAGHKCLAYFNEVIPLNSLLLSSMYYLIYAQMGAGMRDLSDSDFNAWKSIYPVSVGQQSKFWKEVHTRNATISNIKEYKTAGCGELSIAACRWLKEQGINAYSADFCFYFGKEPDDTHRFVLYTLPDTPRLSFAEMMRDLNNPNVRVCDVWCQKCGTVSELLNHYAGQFVAVKDNQYTPIMPGMKALVRESETDLNSDIYAVAHVVACGDEKQVVLFSSPKCFCVAKQRLDIPVNHVKVNG